MAKRKVKFSMPETRHHSVSLSTEKIENGFLSRVSGVHPKQGYMETTRFHKTDPAKHRKGQIARIMANLQKMHN